MDLKPQQDKGHVFIVCLKCKTRTNLGGYEAAQIGCGHDLRGWCRNCGVAIVIKGDRPDDEA